MKAILSQMAAEVEQVFDNFIQLRHWTQLNTKIKKCGPVLPFIQCMLSQTIKNIKVKKNLKMKENLICVAEEFVFF